MSRPRRHRVAGGILVLGCLLASVLAGGASGAERAGLGTEAASTPVTVLGGSALELLQKKGVAAVDRRLDSLAQLRTSVARASDLDPADRRTLEADIDAAISGLGGVRTTISNGTTYRSVSDAVGTIVGTYRVYSVLVPKAHLVIGISLARAAADTIDDVNRSLEGGVGDDAERALLAWSDAAAAAAHQQVDPVLSGVLAANAAGWPANKATLDAAKAALIEARRALGDALDASTRLAAGIPPAG